MQAYDLRVSPHPRFFYIKAIHNSQISSSQKLNWFLTNLLNVVFNLLFKRFIIYLNVLMFMGIYFIHKIKKKN